MKFLDWRARGECCEAASTIDRAPLPVGCELGWGDVESFFKGSTKTVVGIEADFGGDLVDGVVGFFE